MKILSIVHYDYDFIELNGISRGISRNDIKNNQTVGTIRSLWIDNARLARTFDEFVDLCEEAWGERYINLMIVWLDDEEKTVYVIFRKKLP